MKKRFIELRKRVEIGDLVDALGLFLDNLYEREFGGSSEVNGFKKVVLFASIQYLNYLSFFEKVLVQRSFEVLKIRTKRSLYSCQILGCNCYEDFSELLEFSEKDFFEDIYFVYIGDGFFHPKAILLSLYNQGMLSSKIKVVIANPINQKITLLADSAIKSEIKQIKKGLNFFFLKREIGLFVSTKVGQSFKDSVDELRERFPEKNFYLFVGDNFSAQEIENFPFVEVWVNTACPRIAFDDSSSFSKPVVNIKDILNCKY